MINNIKKYNFISDEDLVKPNYDLSKYPYKIRVVFERSGNVLILGMVNDYVYWASYTNVEDTEINAAIFDEITRKDLSRISDEYTLIPKIEMDWDDYHYLLAEEVSPREDGGFDIPFGNGYLAGGDECGKWFASGLRRHLDRMRDLCKTREQDGLYAEVLGKYLKQLEKFTWENYGDDSSIRAIIESERYLYLSDNEVVRGVYIKCARRLYDIYCEYMTRIH